MGLLDGLPATNRKEPDRVESSPAGMVPIDRLAKIAPAARISRARVVDAGRIITAGGIASGMEMGFHLLRRAGYSEPFIAEVARVMEYQKAYELYRDDVEKALEAAMEVGAGKTKTAAINEALRDYARRRRLRRLLKFEGEIGLEAGPGSPPEAAAFGALKVLTDMFTEPSGGEQ
jgi:hypothetical protein